MATCARPTARRSPPPGEGNGHPGNGRGGHVGRSARPRAGGALVVRDRQSPGQAAHRDRTGGHRGTRHQRGGSAAGRPAGDGEIAAVSGPAAFEGAIAMDPVKDAALEREIERALAVDPSPEFLARVRARIADEPAPAARGFGWLFAGVAATAVAVAVVAVVMLRPDQRVEPAVGLLTSRSLTSSVVVPRVSPGLDREPRTTHHERRTPNDEPRTTNPERQTSTPLFDARETTALQRLIADVRDAQVD